MTDPRHSDTQYNEPPASPGSRGNASMWGWLLGIAVVIVIAFVLAAGWNSNTQTASKAPPAATTGAAPTTQAAPPAATTGSGADTPAMTPDKMTPEKMAPEKMAPQSPAPVTPAPGTPPATK